MILEILKCIRARFKLKVAPDERIPETEDYERLTEAVAGVPARCCSWKAVAKRHHR